MGDDDNDGCTNAQELGSNPMLGGGRDPNYYWDFFDVDRDRVVSIGDILLIAGRVGSNVVPPPTKEEALAALPYAPTGPGYHPIFDRSPPAKGADPWDLGPPDGSIATNDVLFAVNQFGHTCL